MPIGEDVIKSPDLVKDTDFAKTNMKVSNAPQFGNPNGNYDQRRSQTNAAINPLTNGSDFGARGLESMEGTSNNLAVIKL